MVLDDGILWGRVHKRWWREVIALEVEGTNLDLRSKDDA